MLKIDSKDGNVNVIAAGMIPEIAADLSIALSKLHEHLKLAVPEKDKPHLTAMLRVAVLSALETERKGDFQNIAAQFYPQK